MERALSPIMTVLALDKPATPESRPVLAIQRLCPAGDLSTARPLRAPRASGGAAEGEAS
jgi:hypothetical protein